MKTERDENLGDTAQIPGMLVGWSAAGTRPEFTMVTGISTGALMAPFAFPDRLAVSQIIRRDGVATTDSCTT